MVASSGERFAAVHAEDPTDQERVCPVARTTFPWSQSPPEMAPLWAFALQRFRAFAGPYGESLLPGWRRSYGAGVSLGLRVATAGPGG
jgi:hypothetical protein